MKKRLPVVLILFVMFGGLQVIYNAQAYGGLEMYIQAIADRHTKVEIWEWMLVVVVVIVLYLIMLAIAVKVAEIMGKDYE